MIREVDEKQSYGAITASVIKGLNDYGFTEVKAGPVARLANYSEIYHERELSSCLTGLEPNYKDLSELSAFTEGYNTLVAVLMPYELLPDNRLPKALEVSRVSIMAWEWDYHVVFKAAVEEALRPCMPLDYRLHVDSGPLPERQIVEALGLASAGRSQMLLNTKYGSAFYIGLILINDTVAPQVCLKANSQLAAICLDCNKCQTHCPSGALFDQRAFDGPKCLSALTQKKGILSNLEMQTMGQHFYGCDYCQLSCPANSPLFKTQKPEGLRPLKANMYNGLNPEELLYLSQKGYKVLFGSKGFAWRGVRTAKRNALINMANSGNVQWLSVIEAFYETLNSETDIELYETATWALEKLKGLKPSGGRP